MHSRADAQLTSRARRQVPGNVHRIHWESYHAHDSQTRRYFGFNLDVVGRVASSGANGCRKEGRQLPCSRVGDAAGVDEYAVEQSAGRQDGSCGGSDSQSNDDATRDRSVQGARVRPLTKLRRPRTRFPKQPPRQREQLASPIKKGSCKRSRRDSVVHRDACRTASVRSTRGPASRKTLRLIALAPAPVRQVRSHPRDESDRRGMSDDAWLPARVNPTTQIPHYESLERAASSRADPLGGCGLHSAGAMGGRPRGADALDD